jgi:hypothetical protein
MAVARFRTAGEFRQIAGEAGWKVTNVADRSDEIMPNLLRLSDMAKGIFRIRLLTRALKARLPTGLVTNAVAGLLMPIAVQAHAHRQLSIEPMKKGRGARRVFESAGLL